MSGPGDAPDGQPVKRKRLRGCLIVVGVAIVAMLALGGILDACTSSDSDKKPDPAVTTPASTQPEETIPPSSPVSEAPPPPLESEPKPDVTTGSTQPTEEESSEPPAGVYYENCDAARAAGAAPLLRGDPGYRDELDREGDGIACEPPP
ncbi:excalibur calcium-binding domain-containing protein [Streptomyces cyaneofuscatus]|uniref:excalibur calcium-binding domain-containing protein n=1 Tax=Streptomyces cyaneofuscatus TaxID=66883 RepID=UPI00378DA9B5